MDIAFDADPMDGALSLYFATKPGEYADLEVAATAAIEWAKGLKAAAAAIDPTSDYRVSLIAAKPGSSHWMAKIEQSAPNKALQRLKTGWEKIPLILRLGIGLAVVIPTTAKPTFDYWVGNEGFSDTQKKELAEIYNKAAADSDVQKHQRNIFREAPKDSKITGIGTGVPKGEEWKPPHVIPSNQFAESEGLFKPQEHEATDERTIPQTLDVILVTPKLENARRAWTFRQEGLPGTFNAEMADPDFLAALDRDGGIHESLRTNISMRVQLEIKQEKVDGEWKVKRRGRRVVKVISPEVE